MLGTSPLRRQLPVTLNPQPREPHLLIGVTWLCPHLTEDTAVSSATEPGSRRGLVQLSGLKD
jgi:hypothetical protein